METNAVVIGLETIRFNTTIKCCRNGLETIPFKTTFFGKNYSNNFFLNYSTTWVNVSLKIVLWIIIFQSSTKSSKGLKIKVI